MKIYQIHDLSDSYIEKILTEGLIHTNSTQVEMNYSPDHQDCNANLFYLLRNGRYKDGCYYVIEDRDQLVACAGWNKYTDDIALVLSRAFVSKEYRTSYIMGEKLLPLMLDSTKSYDKVWITCNEYNKTIYHWFARKQLGKKTAMFADWPEIYSRFLPIGRMNVYNTEQYVVQLER